MHDRHWLLTSTTYGTWLPGDECGFVSAVRDAAGNQIIHNVPGTEYDEDVPKLKTHAQSALLGQPIYFTMQQADALHVQFHETAWHRHWALRAVAIMRNHFHIVVGVEGDPDPEKVLGDFKAYGSRKLSKTWGKPKSDMWWTESGSMRKLPDFAALGAAVEYVRHQVNPFVIWIAGEHPAPEFEKGQRARKGPGG